MLMGTTVFDGLAGVASGVLRACGRQFLGAMLNLSYVLMTSLSVETSNINPSAYYVIGIPFGIWLAFSRHLGLAGLWIGLTLSLVYCAALGSWVCLRTDWAKELRKVEARLANDKDQDAERRLQ
jgi:MATE family multidrug resistance protein